VGDDLTTGHHPHLVGVSEEARVTPIELFFDLVFVFSLTQVTALMNHDLTLHGILRGLLVLALLWWCWVGYAWLGNVVQADEGFGRVAMFGAMAAMFVLALTVPEAFHDLPGGLDGPVVLAMASADDPGLRRQLFRFAPSVLGSTALLVVASQMDGVAQTWMWVAVLVVDYVGTIMAGASGWRLYSASHFAERHGLIILIALGESIVSIGAGVASLPISWAIIAASILGLTIAGALWWTYFDVTSIVAERALRRAEGEQRARMARDAYSYLHLPMMMGIVLVALGMKQVMESVGGAEGHSVSDPLAPVPLRAMYAGAALYLMSHVAFRYRIWHRVSWQRVVTVLIVLALVPLAAQLSALGAVALLAGVLVALIVYEAVTRSEFRERVRHEEG
jgi:low temperature requirement protein LtrA